jgi:hypothetical protein
MRGGIVSQQLADRAGWAFSPQSAARQRTVLSTFDSSSNAIVIVEVELGALERLTRALVLRSLLELERLVRFAGELSSPLREEGFNTAATSSGLR